MTNPELMRAAAVPTCILALTFVAACAMHPLAESQTVVPPGASVPESWQRAPQKDEPKKESVRAPVAPAAAGPRTPVEAQQRAADPKAPTGALIVKPPINVLPPDSQTAKD